MEFLCAVSDGIRINKYLSEVGHCSRRAADKLLELGRITINGQVPELGTKVMPGDTVAVDGQQVGQPTKAEDHVYIAYHKPVGIVCTTDQKRGKRQHRGRDWPPQAHLPCRPFGQTE